AAPGPPARSRLRTSRVTSCPLARSRSTSADPISPLEPVIATRMLYPPGRPPLGIEGSRGGLARDSLHSRRLHARRNSASRCEPRAPARPARDGAPRGTGRSAVPLQCHLVVLAVTRPLPDRLVPHRFRVLGLQPLEHLRAPLEQPLRLARRVLRQRV